MLLRPSNSNYGMTFNMFYCAHKFQVLKGLFPKVIILRAPKDLAAFLLNCWHHRTLTKGKIGFENCIKMTRAFLQSDFPLACLGTEGHRVRKPFRYMWNTFFLLPFRKGVERFSFLVKKHCFGLNCACISVRCLTAVKGMSEPCFLSEPQEQVSSPSSNQPSGLN